jgi:acetolactate synthase-1/2/3 large subunit
MVDGDGLADRVSVRLNRHPGAELMVDVFETLGFEYLFANPSSKGSSRRNDPSSSPAALAQSAEGLRLIVELAETLQASVFDEGWRLNFPTRHPLNLRLGRQSTLAAADVILALEPDDLSSVVHRLRGRSRLIAHRVTRDDATFIRLGVWQLTPRPNYQTVQRHLPIDLDIVADAETALPSLVEAVRGEMSGDQCALVDARRTML